MKKKTIVFSCCLMVLIGIIGSFAFSDYIKANPEESPATETSLAIGSSKEVVDSGTSRATNEQSAAVAPYLEGDNGTFELHYLNETPFLSVSDIEGRTETAIKKNIIQKLEI